MFCPLTPVHTLIEIAPGLYQCPKCGAGPRGGRRFPFWSLSAVEIFGHEAEGLAVRYNNLTECYVMTSLDWAVGDEGRVVAGTLVEVFIEYISTRQEKENATLPVVTGSGSGCSSLLSPLMYEDPLGEKVL